VRVAFLGSGRFAVPSLEALLAGGHEVVGVWTQPDRPQGRGLQLAPPPVKPVALARGLPVHQPRRIREPLAAAALREAGAEIHVVVAYGQILPKAVLDIPSRGTVNVHGSLLPRYRGAAPVQWAIVNGESQTGVTTMLLDEGLDTGPTLLAEATPIAAEETAAELEGRLARIGAGLLVRTLEGMQAGAIVPTPQNHTEATLAPLLKKEDGLVDWETTAEAITRRIRGLHPWPGTWTRFGGHSLRIIRARAEAGGDDAPGVVVAIDAGGVAIACGGATRLRLIDVQPESRRVMPAAAFAAGARLAAGQRLE
jgi:methionyl-tRNA formyltransferase